MEEAHIKLADAERRRLRTKRILIGVVVIFILIIASGSVGGLKLHQKYLETERNKVDSIQDVLDVKDEQYAIRFQEGIDSVQQLNIKENDYFDAMLWYKGEAERLQGELDFIHSLNIDNERLDSLARNIRYPRRDRKN